MAGGLFELKSALQLLQKAEHDFARLQSNPLNSYAAFDLFVTIRHIPEWMYPDDAPKSQALFKQYVELRVCRHIADGAKHFMVSDPRHRQVIATVKRKPAWDRAWGGSWGDAWGPHRLVIKLDPADKDTVTLGEEISVLDLGGRLMTLMRGIVQ